jgi:hypothetical protein
MLIMVLLFDGCNEADTEPEIYEPDKCYEGIFIQGDCPSIAFVQITNADEGISWTVRDKVYENILVIKNYPDSLVNPLQRSFFRLMLTVPRTRLTVSLMNGFAHKKYLSLVMCLLFV